MDILQDNFIKDKIKISKGEVSSFVWSIFKTIMDNFETIISLDIDSEFLYSFEDLEYIIIDDPVSSIDDPVSSIDDNKIISAKFLDKAGKVLSTSLSKDKKIDLATYYTDGTKKGTLTYDSKGNATGHEEVFFPFA